GLRYRPFSRTNVKVFLSFHFSLILVPRSQAYAWHLFNGARSLSDNRLICFPRGNFADEDPKKLHLEDPGKLQPVTGKWFIIGLFDYRATYISAPNFCLSDFWKIFGKELEPRES